VVPVGFYVREDDAEETAAMLHERADVQRGDRPEEVEL
jgi:hypothetical protein